MKIKQRISKLSARLYCKEKTHPGCFKHDQMALQLSQYLDHLDVDKMNITKSPLGGWLCTFNMDEPAETEHSDEGYLPTSSVEPNRD